MPLITKLTLEYSVKIGQTRCPTTLPNLENDSTALVPLHDFSWQGPLFFWQGKSRKEPSDLRRNARRRRPESIYQPSVSLTRRQPTNERFGGGDFLPIRK